MSLHITTIQTPLSWEDKNANLRMLEEKVRAISGYTEIVVLPEMFSTGFSMNPTELAETMDGNTVNWMKNLSASRRVILTGSIIIEDQGKYYNRLLWVLPNGEVGIYDKRHLFGFAGEDASYSSGSRRLIASVKGWKINLMICYDLRFPVWARQSSPPIPTAAQMEKGLDNTPEYDVLVYVANWPDRRIHAWKSLLVARAIENQSYVIGVNRIGHDGNNIFHSGNSMIVDPMGELLYDAASREESQTTILDKGKLQQMRDKLPFLRDADNFMIEP